MQSEVYFPRSTTEYIKDIQFSQSENGSLKLVYSSSGYVNEKTGSIIGIFVYEINKDYIETSIKLLDIILKETKRTITVIIPARNESKFLSNTLSALKKQTLSPHRIIIVNDGSTDNTSNIAKEYDVEIIDLLDRGFRATGEPVLANVINKGLESISSDVCDYVMILGADHIIPPDYISKIISIMDENDSIVIASGTIKGESQRDTSPRGSGRIIRYDFWKKLGLKYPSWYGFESYVVYKALIESYDVKVIRDAVSWTQRPTGKTTNYKNYGKAMRALGYHPLHALGRIVRTLSHNPKAAINLTFGYLDSSVKKYEIASDVSKLQLILMKRKILSKFR